MAIQLNPALRDNATFFDGAKSYARRDEALKRLNTLADSLPPPTNRPDLVGVVDYFIWLTPTGRFVPVWCPSADQSQHAFAAADLGVAVFRR